MPADLWTARRRAARLLAACDRVEALARDAGDDAPVEISVRIETLRELAGLLGVEGYDWTGEPWYSSCPAPVMARDSGGGSPPESVASAHDLLGDPAGPPHVAGGPS